MAHCLGLTEKTAGGPEWLRESMAPGEDAVSVMDRCGEGWNSPRTPASFLDASAHWWLDLRCLSIGRAAAGDPADSMVSSHVGDVD
jgi:hypothetical protein